MVPTMRHGTKPRNLGVITTFFYNDEYVIVQTPRYAEHQLRFGIERV